MSFFDSSYSKILPVVARRKTWLVAKYQGSCQKFARSFSNIKFNRCIGIYDIIYMIYMIYIDNFWHF